MTELLSRLTHSLGSDYRLLRELGGGGMSRVFVATDLMLGRQVVIKVLPPEMAAGVNQERFRREIQLAARLQHPHIVPLLSAGTAGDILYFVMPFIEGESLRARLTRESELPVGEAVRLLREITDALAYAHEQGVVHRDIKPDNVMLSRGHALVTDFGVAKAVSVSSGEASVTSLGVALGTPAYMAPEQASADPHVDHRADLYALGVLAYEMLAGRPPFSGGNAQALLMAHVTRTPEPLRAHRPSVQPALESIVMRCLEKRAADRWQTAGEIIPQLDAALTPATGTAPHAGLATTSSGTEAALRRSDPVRVGVLFAGAALATMSLAWLITRLLGLPDFVVPAAGALLLIGLPIMLLTARREQQRIVARTTGSWQTGSEGLAERLFTWRRALAGGALALGGLALGTGAFMGLRAAGIGPFATLVSAGVLEARDPLVLADFNNRTSDTTLGPSITEAFRIDLTQSPLVRLVEGSEVSATLRRMERDPAGGVNEVVAREVAQRVGAKAVVAGDIAPLGSGFVLTARLVGANDTTLLAARENASDAAGLIAAVERLSRKLREGIGESLKTIRAGQPLEQVTTSSLPALRAYSEGSRLANENRLSEALVHLNQAVSLDSSFGMAWRRIGVVLSNLGVNRPRMIEALTRAHALRDRMPPQEAAHATAFHHIAVEKDRPAAIAAYERLLASWPYDMIALNNLAIYYYESGRDAEAERLMRRAVEARPNAAIYNGNLVEILVKQEKFDAADTVIQNWAARAPGNSSRYYYASAAARERGDFERAAALGESLRNVEQPDAQAFGGQTRSALLRLRGRFAEAEREGRSLLQLSERLGLTEFTFQTVRDIALGEGFALGRWDAAIRRLDAALARHPFDSLPPGQRPYGETAAFFALAGATDRAQALLAEQQREVSEELRDGDPWLAYTRAQLALSRRDGRAALTDLRRAFELLRCTLCTAFDEGRAFELLAQTDSAISRYEFYANERAVEIQGRDFFLAAALRRLGELHESKGDRAKALEYYGRFVDLWKDADPPLQPLVRDVRRHMTELSGDPPR